ncbi:MAG TPA: Uma2 family endonuclease [Pseudonocardiaceae bacterium]
MSAAMAHSIGPNTVADWLAQEPSADGERLELIMGDFRVVPPPSGRHQYSGDELRSALKEALRSGGRTDLYVVTGVGVQISTVWRTALIPDLVVLNTRPIEATFLPEQVEMVVEIWSPGNPPSERMVKKASYATAGVRFFWAIDFDEQGVPTIEPHRLRHGDYAADKTVIGGSVSTITAAPVPVALDPADLLP